MAGAVIIPIVDGETEAQKGSRTCLRMHSCKWWGWDLNVDLLALELQHDSLLMYTSVSAPPASLLWKMWPNNPPTWGGGGEQGPRLRGVQI